MTPEELAQTREGANVDYAPDIMYDDWQAMARSLLAHIDSQAAQIAALKEALIRANYLECSPSYALIRLKKDEKLKAAGVTWDDE